jgi:uncharacterized C2H2 Zn-finger protein
MAKKQEDKIETLNAQYKYDGDGELLSDISSSEPLEELYVCSNCGKEYKTKRGYENHIKKCVIEIDKTNYDVEKVVETAKKDNLFTIKTETVILEETKEEPVNKKIIEEPVKQEPIIEKSIKSLSFKERYESMINDGPFILKMNGSVIFDSEKDDIMSLSFSDDYFRINKVKFPYMGINFKFKK